MKTNEFTITMGILTLLLCLSTTLTVDGYVVKVIDRMVTGTPLILNASESSPYSKNGCGGASCTNVLNPAWLSFAGDEPSELDDGGLFIRLSTPICQPSVIALLPSIPNSKGLAFEAPSDKYILKDGPKDTDKEVALGIDPRAIYRPLTGKYYVFYRKYSWMQYF